MVDQVLAQESNGQTTWMLSDHLGSVRDLINNSGTVVNHFTYDSFGQIVGSIAGATADTRYKFTGREYDSETGLYYYRARYFDAAVGRFIGQDPIGFKAGDSNLYRYVGNNPLNATEPSGNFLIGISYNKLAGDYAHVNIVIYDKKKGYSRRYYAGREHDTKDENGNRNFSLEAVLIAKGLAYKGGGHSISSFNYGKIVKGDLGQRVPNQESGIGYKTFQVVYKSPDCDASDKIETDIRNSFIRIDESNIPYDVISRNSNSAAFQALEDSLPNHERPQPTRSVRAPGWEINPYSWQVSPKAKPLGKAISGRNVVPLYW